jgi:hypothetical protein
VEKEAKKEANKRAGMGDSFVSMEEAKERANLIAIRVKEAKRVKAEAKRAVKAALDVCGKGGSEAGGEGGEGGEGVGEGGEGGCEGGGGGGEGGKGANSTKEPIWLEKLCRRAPRGLHGTKRAKGGSWEVTDWFNGRNRHLGYYDDHKGAAAVYSKYAGVAAAEFKALRR